MPATIGGGDVITVFSTGQDPAAGRVAKASMIQRSSRCGAGVSSVNAALVACSLAHRPGLSSGVPPGGVAVEDENSGNDPEELALIPRTPWKDEDPVLAFQGLRSGRWEVPAVEKSFNAISRLLIEIHHPCAACYRLRPVSGLHGVRPRCFFKNASRSSWALWFSA